MSALRTERFAQPTATHDMTTRVHFSHLDVAGGRSISPRDALHHVFAYGVGVDLTRRDMQRAAKKAGRPWDCSKVRSEVPHVSLWVPMVFFVEVSTLLVVLLSLTGARVPPLDVQ